MHIDARLRTIPSLRISKQISLGVSVRFRLYFTPLCDSPVGIETIERSPYSDYVKRCRRFGLLIRYALFQQSTWWSQIPTTRSMSGAAIGRSIYYGSSGGGFTALGLVGPDPGACAVVNNAQFDRTTWFSTAVEATWVKRLRSVELRHLSKLPLDRRDVLQQLAMLPTSPEVQYWVNTALKHDRQVSLPQWERNIEEFPHFHERMTCRRYYDESVGSPPLGKSETIA